MCCKAPRDSGTIDLLEIRRTANEITTASSKYRALNYLPHCVVRDSNVPHLPGCRLPLFFLIFFIVFTAFQVVLCGIPSLLSLSTSSPLPSFLTRVPFPALLISLPLPLSMAELSERPRKPKKWQTGVLKLLSESFTFFIFFYLQRLT
jgi:hypothetical protein